MNFVGSDIIFLLYPHVNALLVKIRKLYVMLNLHILASSFPTIHTDSWKK